MPIALLAGALASGMGCGRHSPALQPAPRISPEAAEGELAALRVQEGAPGGPQQAQDARALVRRARVELVVGSIEDAAMRVDSLVQASGGETESTQRTNRQFTMVLRVPGDRLDAAVLALRGIGRVESSTVSAVDVTDRLTDMDARLANLRAVRDRLRQYLDRASTIADVIAIERELVRVQSEIDSIESRLTIVRGQVAMSELTVRAREEVRLGPLGVLFAGLGNVLQWLFVLP